MSFRDLFSPIYFYAIRRSQSNLLHRMCTHTHMYRHAHTLTHSHMAKCIYGFEKCNRKKPERRTAEMFHRRRRCWVNYPSLIENDCKSALEYNTSHRYRITYLDKQQQQQQESRLMTGNESCFTLGIHVGCIRRYEIEKLCVVVKMTLRREIFFLSLFN